MADINHFISSCLNVYHLWMFLTKLNIILMYKILIFISHQHTHQAALITVIAVYQAVICVQRALSVTTARCGTALSTEVKN